MPEDIRLDQGYMASYLIRTGVNMADGRNSVRVRSHHYETLEDARKAAKYMLALADEVEAENNKPRFKVGVIYVHPEMANDDGTYGLHHQYLRMDDGFMDLSPARADDCVRWFADYDVEQEFPVWAAKLTEYADLTSPKLAPGSK
jgi:hypothetical protein